MTAKIHSAYRVARSTLISLALLRLSAPKSSVVVWTSSTRHRCFPLSAAVYAPRKTSAKASASWANARSPLPLASWSASSETSLNLPPKPKLPLETARRSPWSARVLPALHAPANLRATALTSRSLKRSSPVAAYWYMAFRSSVSQRPLLSARLMDLKTLA